MVQHTQVGKHNTPHRQNKGQKSHHHLNRCRKAYDKIQHPLMIKTLKKLGTKELYLNIIKAIYDNWVTIIKPNEQNLTFPVKIRNETRVSTVITLIHIVLEILHPTIRQDKEIEEV
jgi:hypothetical protein